jgi:hypothetical protein
MFTVLLSPHYLEKGPKTIAQTKLLLIHFFYGLNGKVAVITHAQSLVVINRVNYTMESAVFYACKSIIKLLLQLFRADDCIDILKCKATTIG